MFDPQPHDVTGKLLDLSCTQRRLFSTKPTTPEAAIFPGDEGDIFFGALLRTKASGRGNSGRGSSKTLPVDPVSSKSVKQKTRRGAEGNP